MSQKIVLAYTDPKGTHQKHAVQADGDWRVRIGASDEQDLRLQAEGVAPDHALVWGQGGKMFVEPATSKAVVVVDGSPIDFPSRLRPGQQFVVAGVVFSLSVEGEAAGGHDAPGRGAAGPAKRKSKAPRKASRKTEPDEDAWLPRSGAAAKPPATGQGSGHDDEPDHTVMAPRGSGSPKPALRAAQRIMLEGDAIRVGRSVDGAGLVDDPQISRHHADLRRREDGWQVRDAGSTNGTYVDGEPANGWTTVQRNCTIAFGPLSFEFTGRSLRRTDDERGMRVDVSALVKTVRHRETGAELRLIDGIDLTVMPGEFVAMLGSSGCGKSTFMDAVNGRRRATAGEVRYNGRSLYDQFASLKRAIGYVPQQVIFHGALGVGDVLRHAARLRLPTDTTSAEIEEQIDAVLQTVGLSDRKGMRAGDLSGGQQKRVSIAMELLGRPKVLFLDEVTSGLDLKTEREMMALFRRLADGGLTIFCITHYLDNLDLCHHLAYFFRGKLAFFGPPEVFRKHFDVKQISQIYEAESAEDADPAAWARRYVESPAGDAFFRQRRDALPPVVEGPAVSLVSGAERSRLSAERFGVQLSTLTRRYVALLLADRATLITVGLLAPVVAGLIAFAAADWPQAAGFQALSVAVMAISSSFFLGLFNATREIVKEFDLYMHERLVGLEITPYLLSKLGPLTVVNLVQSLILLVVLRQTTDFNQVGGAVQGLVLLFLVASVGSLLGLAISALARRVDTAVSLMVFAIVPQLLFASNLGEPTGPRRAAAAMVSVHWAYASAEEMLTAPTPAAVPTPAPPPVAPAPPTNPYARHRPATAAPPAATAPPAPAQPPGTGGGGWVTPLLVLLLQGGLLYAAAFFLLLRRDGPRAIQRFFSGAGRLLQAENRDDRLVLRDWVAGAREGLKKS